MRTGSPDPSGTRSFVLDREAVGCDELWGHHSEGAEALREDVRLHLRRSSPSPRQSHRRT